MREKSCATWGALVHYLKSGAKIQAFQGSVQKFRGLGRALYAYTVVYIDIPKIIKMQFFNTRSRKAFQKIRKPKKSRLRREKFLRIGSPFPRPVLIIGSSFP